jgi:hypothetical protein
VLQDLLESQTVDACAVLFELVEKHADALSRAIEGTQRA